MKEKYPKVKLIYGSNHDSDIIEKAAAEADIVIRMSMLQRSRCFGPRL